ncbi:MAG: tail fiber domain-containing protein [Bacteroidota bacterium]|nr:tail fiber domain-containing protein [Bacteroidota bacterium]
MKHKFLLAAAMSVALGAKAQMQVFSTNQIAIGYYGTIPPPTGFKTHATGKTLFTNTSTGTYGAQITGNDNLSTASTPDYTWKGDDATTGIFHPASNTISFSTSGSERFRFNSSGQFVSYKTASASTPDLTWNGDVSTGIYHPATNNIGFTVAGAERMRIYSNGNVGIGTTTPMESLQIGNSFTFHTGGSKYIGYNTYFDGSNNKRLVTDYATAVTFGYGDISLQVAPSGAAGTIPTFIDALHVKNNGNVGIGTSAPNAKFDVRGASNSTATIIYGTHTSDYGYACIVDVDRDLTKAFSIKKSGTEYFRVYGSGDAWGKSWISWSDRNLKENIDSITNALDKLKQLTGYTYNMKASFTGSTTNRSEMGLIAQEVEKIIPQIVMTDENGIKGVAYQNLIPLLIEAIKEQNKNLTDQQYQIKTLQSDLNNCCQNSNNSNVNGSVGISETENYFNANWLAQNKPNPFNKETVIEYNVVQNGRGSILIFDMNGKLLKTIPVKIPGKGSVTITSAELSAGMYYYTLVVNDVEIDTKKMILTE